MSNFQRFNSITCHILYFNSFFAKECESLESVDGKLRRKAAVPCNTRNPLMKLLDTISAAPLFIFEGRQCHISQCVSLECMDGKLTIECRSSLFIN